MSRLFTAWAFYFFRFNNDYFIIKYKMIITDYYKDAFTEIFNMGVGRAAGLLNKMLETHITLKVPSIDIFIDGNFDVLSENYEMDLVSAVKMGFKGSYKGSATLIFPPQSAAIIISEITDEKPGPLKNDPVRTEALCEVGNVIINSVLGTLSNVLKADLDYTLPVYKEGDIKDILQLKDVFPEGAICVANTKLTAENLGVDGHIVLVFNLGDLEEILKALDQV